MCKTYMQRISLFPRKYCSAATIQKFSNSKKDPLSRTPQYVISFKKYKIIITVDACRAPSPAFSVSVGRGIELCVFIVRQVHIVSDVLFSAHLH